VKPRRFLFFEDYLYWMIPYGYGDTNWPGRGEVWEEVLNPDLTGMDGADRLYIQSGEKIRIRPINAEDDKRAMWIPLGALLKFADPVQEPLDES